MLEEVQNTSPLQLYHPLHHPHLPHQDNILHLKSPHRHSGLHQQTESAASQRELDWEMDRQPVSQSISQLGRDSQSVRQTDSQSNGHSDRLINYLDRVRWQTPVRKLQLHIRGHNH